MDCQAIMDEQALHLWSKWLDFNSKVSSNSKMFTGSQDVNYDITKMSYQAEWSKYLLECIGQSVVENIHPLTFLRDYSWVLALRKADQKYILKCKQHSLWPGNPTASYFCLQTQTFRRNQLPWMLCPCRNITTTCFPFLIRTYRKAFL
jgi:hypothetical protein